MNLVNKIVILISLSLYFCCENILCCKKFSDKVVIVTGGSSGIGRSTAIKFAKEGAKVTIVGRNEDRLQEVADKICEVGLPALVVKADLTNDEEARQVIEKTKDKFGKIDVLVNAAGFTIPAKLCEENYMEVFDKVMSLNLRAPVRMTNVAIPDLIDSKGNIINIASDAAHIPLSISGAHYSTSKAALVMFTKSCAMELAEFGIRANTVSPGATKTHFFEAAGLNVDYEEFAEKTSALKQLIQPEEIADGVLYLASDKAKSITGCDFVIDAGALVKDHAGK